MAPTKKDPRQRAAASTLSAEQRAKKILDDLGIRSAPVHVENIARRLGLEVERAALGDDVSGLLVVQDGRGVIGVNSSQATTRQRFTIAHEIGHFVLHRGRMPVFIDKQFLKPYFAVYRDSTSSTGEDRMERDANSFAAALLMPKTLVLQAINDVHGHLDDLEDDEAVNELAKRFQVSRQSMSFRLAKLEATSGVLSR